MTDKKGRLAGKVAVVTGGNSGMGAGTVELFVAEGARVVIAARGEEAGQALADRLGENAIFKRTDVSVEADVKALIDTTIEKETQRIKLLKEYRQSLISEVVTGKVDVRDEVLV